MPFSLSQERRIRRSGEYRRVYDGGRKVVGRYLILFFLEAEASKVGITVSGKVGNACDRNRIKRRLREILRSMPLDVGPQAEMVFVAKRQANSASFEELKKDVGALIEKARR